MKTLQEGCQLQGGKYKVKRMLGQGGFGITYEGVQTGLERRVAIKEFFMKDYCNREADTFRVTVGTEGSRKMVSDYRMKFLKEALLIARMDDVRGVVRIYDIFEENQTAYYVMEFIPGGSLKQLVAERGRLPEAEAIGYIKQVGRALEQLHGQNILHLDIKPENILVNKKGEAVLIDFGVSKHYDNSGHQTSSTPVGLSKGFAPTEQYQQDGVNRFSPATDVYSLGATLLFLLTAQVPPDANLVFEDGLPPRPSYISINTWRAIEQAMQPKRKDRTQTVGAFMLELSKIEKPQVSTVQDTSGTRVVESVETVLSTDNETSTPTLLSDDEDSQTDNNGRTSIFFLIKASIILLEIVFFLLMFNNRRKGEPDSEGVMILWGYAIASLGVLIYLITNKKWNVMLVRILSTVAFFINTLMVPMWNHSMTLSYVVLSIGLFVISSFSLCVNRKEK